MALWHIKHYRVIHAQILFIHHHHHHVMLLAWISLILSRHFSLSFIASGRSSGLHPVSTHSCCMYVLVGCPAFARLYVGSIGVHHLWARPCFSSIFIKYNLKTHFVDNTLNEPELILMHALKQFQVLLWDSNILTSFKLIYTMCKRLVDNFTWCLQ